MEQALAQRNSGVSLKPGKSRAALTITHPNAAGIDIGSASHFVAVPPDRDDEPVREFASFTTDLNAMADWLKACGIDTVAMESTGVYWIPVFELLESRGFTVMLINARHVKNVSGRKSDVLDCQWIQQLMTYGLLRGAFRPAEQVCVLRSLWRQRGMLLRSQSRHVQHMQKALTQMNVQLANVISDVVGETGQKILRAILAGERDGDVLAEMKNARIRASVDEIAKSLQGNWRAEHLFALRQAVDAFDFIGKQLAECDHEIEQQLQRLQTREGEPARGKQRGRARNAPKFDLRTQLFRMCGVDLTRIDGLDVTTALAVISETGGDMSRFPSAAHFASWLGLCPGTRITGGKVMSGKTKRCANHAAQALRMAAAALRTSQSALGAYFRRMCSRMDKPKAVTATAHKLARLIYTMLTKGEEYTDQGQDYYEERYRERVLRQLSQRAQKLGMKLVATEQPQPA
ncbi:IS110 family transposase [Paraburkholderia aspalathi]|uniref:IS110 family transposase n=1 Tax=Paraburkholderia aspalathi TaxID=1324617 RepID=UPI003558B5B1